MTRRVLLAGAGALVSVRLRLKAETGLTPLDEAAFRQVVAAHRGKILLVDFWATWCAPCREELPKLVSLHAENKQKGFDFITVSCDEPEQETEAVQFLTKQGAPEPHYIRHARSDDAFINAIDPKWSGALPALFLFDRAGRQAQSFVGEVDIKQLKEAVTKLIAT
jgi:thiol-disulfide isomerase/thioredoxin